MAKVIVLAHDPEWAQRFKREAELVRVALWRIVSAIHHIGSTSISGIYAKPIIDMLVEVTAIEAVDECAQLLVEQGYEAMGEYGLPGRRYFRKNSKSGIRTYQLHIYAKGSMEVVRHLAFRNYLRSHPGIAREYSELKRKLAEQYPDDIQAYMDGKDPFIKTTERAALDWWRSD